MSQRQPEGCRSDVRTFLLCLVLVGCSAGGGQSVLAEDAAVASAGVVDAGGIDFSACDQIPDSGVDYCPGLRREWCRLDVVTRFHASGCSRDSDCAFSDFVPNCIGYGDCEPKPTVLVTRMTAYLSALASEVEAYCAPMTCRSGASCAALDTAAVCRDGVCTAVIR